MYVGCCTVTCKQLLVDLTQAKAAEKISLTAKKLARISQKDNICLLPGTSNVAIINWCAHNPCASGWRKGVTFWSSLLKTLCIGNYLYLTTILLIIGLYWEFSFTRLQATCSRDDIHWYLHRFYIFSHLVSRCDNNSCCTRNHETWQTSTEEEKRK